MEVVGAVLCRDGLLVRVTFFSNSDTLCSSG